MDRNAFVKSHALGNDYLIIDAQALSFPLTERAIRLICDRHRGVGSDGILTPVPPVKADFGLRIFNPDGSEAEKSGNGLRIFARYLYDHGLTRKTQFTVETAGGIVAIRLHLRGTAVDRITVEMGRATFHSERIPVTGPPREVIDEAVDVDGQSLAITAVSMGNPHCVVFVPDLHRVDLHHLGPRLERHPMFPKRTNVQFAQVQAHDRVAALIWERGAGETLASGSSACAVAAAAVRKRLVDRTLTVAMQGGELQISVSPDWTVEMTGPALEICRGILSAPFLSALEAGE